MRLGIHISITAALASGLFMLGGCSILSSFGTGTGDDTEAKPQQRDHANLRKTEYGIAYATDRPSPEFEKQANGEVDFGGRPETRNGRHAALPGLYGELVSHSSTAKGRFDGSGNLAQITAVTEGACFDPDIDHAAQFMAFASTQHGITADIYVKSTTGKTITQITADPSDDVMPSIAPDKQRIAFASNRSGNWDIYITTVNGDPAMQLTSASDDELHPTWSPDGRMLAYSRYGSQSGRWEIWVVDVENTSTPQFLEYGLFPQWNPDPIRSKIVFQRARARGSRLFSVWTIDYVGGESMHPTEIISAANAAAMHPSWSPDGSRIAFVTVVNPDRQDSDRPGQSDVWVINLDGTGRTNLTNGRFLNLYPVWAADGTVYFLSDRSGTDNIWAVATGRTLAPSTPLSVPMTPASSGLVTVEADR